VKIIKPHIRLNTVLGFWICSSDHRRIRGPVGQNRRIQGIAVTPRAAFERWREHLAFERMEGGIV